MGTNPEVVIMGPWKGHISIAKNNISGHISKNCHFEMCVFGISEGRWESPKGRVASQKGEWESIGIFGANLIALWHWCVWAIHVNLIVLDHNGPKFY